MVYIVRARDDFRLLDELIFMKKTCFLRASVHLVTEVL
jgi:hypothetical protein